jgi:hypothetical protein
MWAVLNSFSYLDYAVSNGRTIDELKEYGGKRAWPNRGTISAFDRTD